MTESSEGEKGNIIPKVIQKRGAEGWGKTMAGPRPHGKFSVAGTAVDCLGPAPALYLPECLSFPRLPLAETWLMWRLGFPATLQCTSRVSRPARQRLKIKNLCASSENWLEPLRFHQLHHTWAASELSHHRPTASTTDISWQVNLGTQRADPIHAGSSDPGNLLTLI